MVEVSSSAAHGHPWEPSVTRCCDPAIFVERAVSEHLEVLNVTRARSFRVVEAVHHADAFDGLLFHAIHLHRLGKMRCLQNGRGNVDDMVKLRAYSACVLDAVRPRYNQRVARATE